MHITLEFVFTETGDCKDPVDLPETLASTIPNAGDFVSVRKGYLRPVKTRHFTYEADRILITVICQ